MKSTVTRSVTFLDFVTPLLYSQSQTDIHFDFCNIFDIIPHELLLHKFIMYLWITSQLLKLALQLCKKQIVSYIYFWCTLVAFTVLSDTSYGSVFRPLLFNICTNDLRDVINHSKGLTIAVYQAIKSPIIVYFYSQTLTV
jgi:hypothetical protein